MRRDGKHDGYMPSLDEVRDQIKLLKKVLQQNGCNDAVKVCNLFLKGCKFCLNYCGSALLIWTTSKRNPEYRLAFLGCEDQDCSERPYNNGHCSVTWEFLSTKKVRLYLDRNAVKLPEDAMTLIKSMTYTSQPIYAKPYHKNATLVINA